MATSKRQLILENIKAAFALITVAGGYNFTVGYKGIGAKHITEIPADMFPALIVAGADEDRNNVTNSGFKSVMDVSIFGCVRSSDVKSPEIAESDLSKLISDLTKALYVDHTRGGNCTYTEIGVIQADKGYAQPYAAFEMTVQVEYRGEFTAP